MLEDEPDQTEEPENFDIIFSPKMKKTRKRRSRAPKVAKGSSTNYYLLWAKLHNIEDQDELEQFRKLFMEKLTESLQNVDQTDRKAIVELEKQIAKETVKLIRPSIVKSIKKQYTRNQSLNSLDNNQT